MKLLKFLIHGLGSTQLGAIARAVPGTEKAYGHFNLKRRHVAGTFSGLYTSHKDALAAVPASRPQGWDNHGAATVWEDGEIKHQPSIYPVFFWLSSLLTPGAALIDFGGGVGGTFYPYLRRNQLPAGAQWVVVDVPAMVEEGRKLAQKRSEDQLTFSADPAVTDAQIVLSAGAIQYIDQTIPQLFQSFKSAPQHVIINKAPLCEGQEYWTLQNFGAAISPYKVFNEAQFFQDFENMGYELVDRWRVYEVGVEIPFHPEKHLAFTQGAYFRRKLVS